MDALTAQLHEEVRRVMEVLCELTQLPSQWSGNLELVPDADFKGRKPFNCDIQINQALALLPERWSTLVHEALHALSTGYFAVDFWNLPGWEEGVVEQLQRLFRAIILSRIGITVEAEVFRQDEVEHQYNIYIDALERLRAYLNIEEVTFYVNLLKTPIKQRPAYIYGLGNQLSTNKRKEFIYIYSVANSVLKGTTYLGFPLTGGTSDGIHIIEG